MRTTEKRLRSIVREVLREQSKRIGGDVPSEEVPEDIQQQVDANSEEGMPSEAVYDEETDEWTVTEIN